MRITATCSRVLSDSACTRAAELGTAGADRPECLLKEEIRELEQHVFSLLATQDVVGCGGAEGRLEGLRKEVRI